ncbi:MULTISPECIES: DUF3298 domain-containing protein [unclassified Caballeronia]|uniref:DUF3298 domain-containing protein n=1 Tax=unclassified Caballeronia TaxID=2646786 RepID=UPI0013EB15AC|nr:MULTISPECIES: DUF3298 domain-containing protein [unclassified Caballeronia]
MIVSLSVACLAPSIATAASFDCGNARTRFEKTVCADLKLSAQDALMAQRYDAALSSLSDPGKMILRTGQQQWLKVVKVLCLDNKRDESPTSCLRRQYADRLDDLRSAATSIGPFVFSRIDHYTSIGKQEVTGMPLEQHTGLPRIDHPISPIAEQWNGAIVRSAATARANWCFGDAETASDQFVDFTVQSAMPDFINVEMLHTEQCAAGAASVSMSNISYLLKPALHRLKPEDLFTPDSGWETFLRDRALQGLNVDPSFADGIGKDVRDPAAWSFTKEALLISFNPGEADAMASGILEVTVPWTDLHRLLALGAPIPR